VFALLRQITKPTSIDSVTNISKFPVFQVSKYADSIRIRKNAKSVRMANRSMKSNVFNLAFESPRKASQSLFCEIVGWIVDMDRSEGSCSGYYHGDGSQERAYRKIPCDAKPSRSDSLIGFAYSMAATGTLGITVTIVA